MLLHKIAASVLGLGVAAAATLGLQGPMQAHLAAVPAGRTSALPRLPLDTPTATATNLPPTATATVACGPAWRVVPGAAQMNGYLAAIAGLGANDIWAGGGPSNDLALAEHWNGSAWSVADVGFAGNLTGFAPVATGDVWAVGTHTSAGGTVAHAAHWDGAGWTDVPVALPPGTASFAFNGASAVAPDDVWAVGFYAATALGTLIEHWDGSAWAAIPSPNLGSAPTRLLGVAARTATDIWAVGYANSGATAQTVTEHWDGTAWSLVPSPNIAGWGSELAGVVTLGAANAWAVGFATNGGQTQTLIEHWDGTAWTITASPNPGTMSSLKAVAATGPNDLWAVGSTNQGGATLVEHWAGSQWTVVPSVDVGDDEFGGVYAAAPADVWAVGDLITGGNAGPLIEHYNDPCVTPAPTGTATPTVTGTPPTATRTRTPAPTRTPLPPSATATSTGTPTRTATPLPPSLTATPTNSPTTTATGTPPTATCTSNWALVSSLNRGQDNALNAVEFAAPNDGWAVGQWSPVHGGPVRTLTEHWDGITWSVGSSPNPSANYNTLGGMSVLSSTNIWAVGTTSITHSQDELALNWNGQAWNYSGTPGSESNLNQLMDVVALAPNNVWAIGAYYISFYRPYGLHWDGVNWTHVDMPLIGTNFHYLQKMAAAGPNEIWAVGYYRAGWEATQYYPFIERFDGTSWDLVPVPSPGQYTNVLLGVGAVRDTAQGHTTWAVGWNSNFFGDTSKTFVIRWNGSNWTTIPSPNAGQGDNELLQVQALADNDVWAVGAYKPTPTASLRTLIMHWDGNAWSVVPGIDPGSGDNVLNDITFSGDSLWATGYYYDANGNQNTLIERYDRHCPPLTATPTPTGTSTYTPTATGTSTYTPTATATWTATPLPSATAPATGTPSPAVSPTAVAPTATGTPPPSPAASPTDTPPTPSPALTRTPALPTVTVPPGSTATVTATPCAILFSDVYPSDYFYTPVLYLACHGVISGYADGSFHPYNQTTRSQMVKIVVLGFGTPITTPAGGAYTFQDVPPSNPFFAVIETAAAHTIVSGYTCGQAPAGPCVPPQNRPYFLPFANVTRGQLAKIDVVAARWPVISPVAPTFTDVLPGSTFYRFVETAVCYGVVSGYADHTFRLGNAATRGQIAKIVYLSVTSPPGPCAGPAGRH